jgi:hypothetical protein
VSAKRRSQDTEARLAMARLVGDEKRREEEAPKDNRIPGDVRVWAITDAETLERVCFWLFKRPVTVVLSDPPIAQVATDAEATRLIDALWDKHEVSAGLDDE